ITPTRPPPACQPLPPSLAHARTLPHQAVTTIPAIPRLRQTQPRNSTPLLPNLHIETHSPPPLPGYPSLTPTSASSPPPAPGPPPGGYYCPRPGGYYCPRPGGCCCPPPGR
ncbi:hypothetical protein GNI_107930, partial [Gregarina niphandrodes]